jgi:hypothetical protein
MFRGDFFYQVPKQLTNPAMVSTKESYFTATWAVPCKIKICAIFNFKTTHFAEFIRKI